MMIIASMEGASSIISLICYCNFVLNKVSLQISLERNPTNSSYIFISSVNFKNLTVRLHVLITSLMLTKFQENQRSIAMSSNKCYNFKFL